MSAHCTYGIFINLVIHRSTCMQSSFDPSNSSNGTAHARTYLTINFSTTISEALFPYDTSSWHNQESEKAKGYTGLFRRHRLCFSFQNEAKLRKRTISWCNPSTLLLLLNSLNAIGVSPCIALSLHSVSPRIQRAVLEQSVA